MSKPKHSRYSTFFIVAIVLLTIVAYAVSLALANYTMTDRTVVFLASGILAVFIAFVCRGGMSHLLGIGNGLVNVLIGTVVFTGVVSAGFYTVNFCFSRSDSRHTEMTVVVNKYKEKHYRSKRVARNRYTRGEAYYEYYVDLKYPGGESKPMLVNLQRYRKIKPGDSIAVNMELGLLGFPVVKSPRTL